MSYQTEKVSWQFVGNKRQGNDEDMMAIQAFCTSFGLDIYRNDLITMDLNREDVQDVLEAVKAFCRDRDFTVLTGFYFRDLGSADSEWFAFRSDEFDAIENESQCETVDGKNDIMLPVIKACYNRDWRIEEFGLTLVPDCVRRWCLENGYDDVRFCWVRDSGIYDGEQYFAMLPEKKTDHVLKVYVDYYRLNKWCKKKRVLELGGKLPDLFDLFGSMSIHFSDSYLKSDLPHSGFCHTGVSRNDYIISERILIHRDTVNRMLQDGVINEDDVEPVGVFEKPFTGSKVVNTQSARFPSDQICLNRLEEYQKLKEQGRPSVTINNDFALQVLRQRREIRPEGFAAAMPETEVQRLREGPYRQLAEFYGFSNGFQLDDKGEYRFLSYQEAAEKTAWIMENNSPVDRMLEGINGVVFASRNNGDLLLLREEGDVALAEYESWFRWGCWPDLAVFICSIVNGG